jgi:ketosteroid isomerase-like protein
MQTQVREPITRVGEAGPRRAPTWLIVLAVILAVALIGLGTWVIVDRASAPPPADEITRITQDSLTAWDTGDVDSIAAMYAEDARFWDGPPQGEPLYAGNEAIAGYAAELDGMSFVLEPASATTVVDDTSITVVRYGGEGDMTTALGFIEVNDDGLIVRQWLEPIDGVTTVD